MKTIILSASMLLAACTTTGGLPAIPTASEVTAPVRATNIDEQGIKLAFDTFDTVLTAVDGLIAARVIEPGSSRALQLRSLLYRVQQALNAASSAQKVGNAESYAAALDDAKSAYASIQNIIQGVK